jgi:hypothetical protein
MGWSPKVRAASRILGALGYTPINQRRPIFVSCACDVLCCYCCRSRVMNTHMNTHTHTHTHTPRHERSSKENGESRASGSTNQRQPLGSRRHKRSSESTCITDGIFRFGLGEESKNPQLSRRHGRAIKRLLNRPSLQSRVAKLKLAATAYVNG